MATYVFSDVAARATLFGSVAVWGLAENLGRVQDRQRGGRQVDRGTLPLFSLCVGPGVAAAVVIARYLTATAFGKHPAVAFVAGIVVLWLGLALRFWAIRTLGRFFTRTVRVHKDQKVVTTGPYRWVRHPSYSGLLVIALGVGVALGNWLSLAVVLVAVLVPLIVRIRVEEEALDESLGEPYRDYCRTHKRLIPGLW